MHTSEYVLRYMCPDGRVPLYYIYLCCGDLAMGGRLRDCSCVSVLVEIGMCASLSSSLSLDPVSTSSCLLVSS